MGTQRPATYAWQTWMRTRWDRAGRPRQAYPICSGNSDTEAMDMRSIFVQCKSNKSAAKSDSPTSPADSKLSIRIVTRPYLHYSTCINTKANDRSLKASDCGARSNGEHRGAGNPCSGHCQSCAFSLVTLVRKRGPILMVLLMRGKGHIWVRSHCDFSSNSE